MCFANIFFQLLACILIFLTVFLTEQKLFILIKSRLSITSFMDHIFGIDLKSYYQTQSHLNFSPMFSSKSFIA